MAHDQDIGRRQRVREEIAGRKFDPAPGTALCQKLLEDRLYLWQIISNAGKMRVCRGKCCRHHALRTANVGESVVVLPREFRCNRLGGAKTDPLMAARNPRNLSGSE